MEGEDVEKFPPEVWEVCSTKSLEMLLVMALMAFNCASKLPVMKGSQITILIKKSTVGRRESFNIWPLCDHTTQKLW